MSNRKENNRITWVLGILCGLFIIPILYLSYFQVFRAEEIKDHSSNRRIWAGEEQILRGTITDRNGEVLAYSERDESGNQDRIYNYDDIYGHIIGYSYRAYGRYGLESEYNTELLNLREKNPLNELQEILRSGDEKHGNDITLTIDHVLQEKAYELLEGKSGSIVLMSPETGEVYAMASNPSFNPSALAQEWNDIVEDENSPLLNRATMGLYAPGSIFKLITATGIIEELDPEETYNCTGSITIDGYTLRNYNSVAHGEINLETAIEKSCNTYFASKGLELGEDKLKELASRYMLNTKIPFDLNTTASRFTKENMTKSEIGATSIGQGKTLVTPLNMALMVSAIANNGEMVKPIIVDEVRDHEGILKNKAATEIISNVGSEELTNELEQMMVRVVQSGTGTGARIRNIRVAGKTGTAENETENTHAWFSGFAPAENPKVAIVVMLEYAGTTGGSASAPIAREMITEALNRIEN
jgi:penicillin-binding protein A